MVRVRVTLEKRSRSKYIGLHFVLCSTKKAEKRSHSFTFQRSKRSKVLYLPFVQKTYSLNTLEFLCRASQVKFKVKSKTRKEREREKTSININN